MALSWYFLGMTEENQDIFCQDSDVVAEILTHHHPNRGVGRCRYSCPPKLEPYELSTEHTKSIFLSLTMFLELVFIPSLL
jgi:hypothetical protein